MHARGILDYTVSITPQYCRNAARNQNHRSRRGRNECSFHSCGPYYESAHDVERSQPGTVGVGYDGPLSPFPQFKKSDIDQNVPTHLGFNWATNKTAITTSIRGKVGGSGTMRTKQLREMGVPDECFAAALQCIQNVAKKRVLRGSAIKDAIATVVADPSGHIHCPNFGPLAESLRQADAFVAHAPIAYRTWGSDIDAASHAQMRQACAVPGVRGAALMPDAHVGYGLPIGGVLAVEGAVIPYAVGVDIACRMKLSVLDVDAETLTTDHDRYRKALESGTRFGVGSVHERPQVHDVMDRDWTVSRVTREHRDRAWRQLGTSGSGNHFVEFGVLTIDDRIIGDELGLPPGRYVALLSHSGSRGVGAAVCDTYSNIARARLPRRYAECGRLAWLGLETQEGQEYWQAMNLMGDYAAANHDVIHRLVNKLAGAEVIAGVENHHNFAWKERHGDRELVVHRKGATPAGEGVLGVIPGSMGSPAYVVRGTGHPESFASASHGAGRRMSRTEAKRHFTWGAVQKDLLARGIHVLSAGADEVPGVYKDIDQVMAQQQDLVDVLARFDPRVVKMCGDGSRAED
jgi:tRNA-splicing ligase RtcB